MHNADYVTLDNRLAFVEVDGEGTPLLCIHTAGQSGVQYRTVRAGLAKLGFKVIVVDLPGHGRSEPAVDGPISDVGWYSDWCLKLLDTMSMTRPYVLGCSIGGKIALDMAVKASPRLSGVVAMEAAFARTADRRSRRILEDSASPSVRDGNYLMNLVLCGHLAKPERVEMIAQMHCREDWIVTAADVIGFRSHYLWDSLSSVACPVYLVVGEDGAIPREHSRGTADQIPGAHFEIVDGIGHYPMEEMDDFVERFAGWVRILAADVCQGRMGANAK